MVVLPFEHGILAGLRGKINAFSDTLLEPVRSLSMAANEHSTAMAREAAEAPAVVQAMLERNREVFGEIVSLLQSRRPSHILMSARGSSDHAASYLKYLCEICLGIPCCSLGASVVSIYGTELKLRDTVLISISQSGQSPDILALEREIRRAGVLSVALTNQENSPLARSADICLALHAGSEDSPAATKSFIASITAAAYLVALWSASQPMIEACKLLPAVLRQAWALSWASSYETLVEASSLFCIGRGPSLAIAHEAALKLKETSGLHAEAFSAAEVMHGPLELVNQGFPVIVFCPADRAETTTLDALVRLKAAGARTVCISRSNLGDISLPYAPTVHPLLAPISMIHSFYKLTDDVARMRGRNPDRPRHLRKETATL
jgi:glucosamine--fructose-6-phosphate aminotransferase (isomerizing)